VYALGTLGYTTFIKKLVLADVFALAGLYTARIVIGAAAINVELSHWLFAFSLLLFFSLSLAKRHGELVKATMSGGDLGRLLGRGYRPDDATLLLALGVSSTMCAVLLLSLYVATDAYRYTGYSGPGYLWGAVVSVFAWSTRVWLKSHRGELDSDPVVFALRDPVSRMIIVVSGLFFFLSVI
jgi:4-hydroxybenzoate polyprenyltransferase